MIHTGTTRDNFEGKKVVRLEYEAYESQALAEMKKICTLIREKWSVYGIALLHRIGLVYIEDHWPRGPTQTNLMYFIIYFGNLKQQFVIYKSLQFSRFVLEESSTRDLCWIPCY